MAKLDRIDATLVGVGTLIKSWRFSIPIYQRPYSWEDEHVRNLFSDISDAFLGQDDDYFIGTIVTAKDEEGRLTIIDGQQRIVTASILISTIRNYFLKSKQDTRRNTIEQEYLFKSDRRTNEKTPQILLTPEDRDFYLRWVAAPPEKESPEPENQAQVRLANAIRIADEYVKKLTEFTQKPDDQLLGLLDFLDEQTKLVSVSVSNESSAFVIFEVLNDRGLELSVADLLKNFVFRTAGKRLREAQAAWLDMTTLISELGSEKDVKTFIRQSWSAKYGMTREKDLYDAIKNSIKTESEAIDFAKRLATGSKVFVGLSNPSSDIWRDHDSCVQESIEILDKLAVSQLRPLLLAIFEFFQKVEINKSIPMIVSWTVRFLICGSGGSGTLEKSYAETAMAVSNKQIKNAMELYDGMQRIIPDDLSFEDSFSRATVSRPQLAKYYLSVLNHFSSPGSGELFVSLDEKKVNLEHILPQTQSPDWSHIPADQYVALSKRIGNLTLISAKLNSKAANSGFEKKKEYYLSSEIHITKELANLSAWTAKEIEERQLSLAKLAVKAWPAKPRAS